MRLTAEGGSGVRSIIRYSGYLSPITYVTVPANVAVFRYLSPITYVTVNNLSCQCCQESTCTLQKQIYHFFTPLPRSLFIYMYIS